MDKEPEEVHTYLFRSIKELDKHVADADIKYWQEDANGTPPTLPVYLDVKTGEEVTFTTSITTTHKKAIREFKRYRKDFPDAEIVSKDAVRCRKSRKAFVKHINRLTSTPNKISKEDLEMDNQNKVKKLVLFKSEQELSKIVKMRADDQKLKHLSKDPTLPIYIDNATGKEVECSYAVECYPDEVNEKLNIYRKNWPDAKIVSVDAKFERHSEKAFKEQLEYEPNPEGKELVLFVKAFNAEDGRICGVFSDKAAKDLRMLGQDLELHQDVNKNDVLVTATFNNASDLRRYIEAYPDTNLASQRLRVSSPNQCKVKNIDRNIEFYKEEMTLTPLKI